MVPNRNDLNPNSLASPATMNDAARHGVALSSAQERLWLLEQLQPGSAVYNLSLAWHVSGALDVATLERALAAIVRRHQTLRTRFTEISDTPVQVIGAFDGFSLRIEALARPVSAEREDAVHRWLGAAAAEPFDLQAGPP